MKVVYKGTGKGKTTELVKEVLKYVADKRPDEVYILTVHRDQVISTVEVLFSKAKGLTTIDRDCIKVVSPTQFKHLTNKSSKVTFIDDFELFSEFFGIGDCKVITVNKE